MITVRRCGAFCEPLRSVSSLRAFGLVLLLSCVPALALAQTVAAPTGKYACSYNGSPRPGLNFTILDGGRYADPTGREGTVTAAGSQITFQDAGLKGLSAAYKGGDPPTFNILGPNGAPALLCELAPH